MRRAGTRLVTTGCSRLASWRDCPRSRRRGQRKARCAGPTHRILPAVPASVHAGDGLRLTGAYITAAPRCAPPANKPRPIEMQRCQPYLLEELALLKDVRVVVALGKIGWDAYLRARRAAGRPLPRPLPRFGHAARSAMPDGTVLLGSFHPSQQNTFTGKR